jgi:hypothetical protein
VTDCRVRNENGYNPAADEENDGEREEEGEIKPLCEVFIIC